MSLDWSKYPNFTEREFKCQHTGKCEMKAEFMDKLQELRRRYGKAMKITSGYRAPEHPIEAAKFEGGPHTTGKACDVGVSGPDAYQLVKLAYELGFTGIGINKSFVHLDMAYSRIIAPRPNIWVY